MTSVVKIAAIFALIVSSSLAQARSVPAWDIAELFEKSDLVLIVTHTQTADAKDGDKKAPFESPEDSRMLTPVVSELTVHRVLKGEYSGKEFRLSHHRFDWSRYEQRAIGNGPNLIQFSKPERFFKKEYMLFLKKNKDGIFLPVTGMFDPVYSVKELVTPQMNYSPYGSGPNASVSATEK